MGHTANSYNVADLLNTGEEHENMISNSSLLCTHNQHKDKPGNLSVPRICTGPTTKPWSTQHTHQPPALDNHLCSPYTDVSQRSSLSAV